MTPTTAGSRWSSDNNNNNNEDDNKVALWPESGLGPGQEPDRETNKKTKAVGGPHLGPDFLSFCHLAHHGAGGR